MDETRKDDRPLYNSRIISTYIKFVRTNYNYVSVAELLSHANMEAYQVEDEGHWFTQEQVNRFYEKLVKATNNINIAREAGRYSASPETSGLARQYVLGFVGPARVYELIGKATPNFTRSATYEARKVNPSTVEITVTPIEGVKEQPFQCENRIGYFEAIARVFNYKLPRIEHTECLFNGGRSCKYTISWQEQRSSFWKKVRNLSAGVLLLAFVMLYVLSLTAWMPFFLPAAASVLLFLTIVAGTIEKRELTAAIDNLRLSTDKLFEQTNINYNNALLVNEVGLALSRQTDIEGILRQVVQVLENRLDYDRGMILLANKERTRLGFKAGFGYTGSQSEVLTQTSFHLDRPEARGVLVTCFREQKPFLINDINEIKEDLSPRSVDFVREMGAKSFICCPIVYVEETIGVLAVDNLRTKRPLLQSDINLLMGIAPEIAISIHNATLIDARERQFNSILQVLATSIDARDNLTSGHSEKVTGYAVGISTELGMPKEYVEMIRVAALLHDYGKIAIKDDILKKRGTLTADEYDEIKTHADKSRQILEKVNFEGIYRAVPDVAGSHHEKYDGTGYPKGLRGEEIPLGARILAVADVFEAVTSKRHYRDPMPIDEALSLLDKDRGKHFDSTCVDAFKRFFEKEEAKKRGWPDTVEPKPVEDT
jgi:HD-GYP domain-containing protein (c-di-GMP phosphodiesterase class II)